MKKVLFIFVCILCFLVHADTIDEHDGDGEEDKPQEDCCDFILDQQIEHDEFLEEALQDLELSDETIEMLEGSLFNDDDPVENMLEVLRAAGASNELLELSRGWLEESLESEDLPSKTPEDVRVSRGIKSLENLIPDLQGVSQTWKLTKPTVLFTLFSTAIAKHHKLPDAEINRLHTAIDRFIDIVPESNEELINTDTNHYFRMLVLHYQRLLDELSEFDSDKQMFTELRDELLSANPNANTMQIDRFLTCVDKVYLTADKEFSKLFSSLTETLEKKIRIIEKLGETEDEHERFMSVTKSIGATLVPHSNKIVTTIFKVTNRNCYLVVDVDRLNSEIQKQLGDKNG
ncbi:MAG: hypothetical protein OXG88_11390 [Gammaproteobacteria bacterium]|nr:hypothetical protein [Gammaproteobacteria bacterium]